MSATPTPPGRRAFADCTNVVASSSTLPTPPTDSKVKRRVLEYSGANKRTRLLKTPVVEIESDESDNDVLVDRPEVVLSRQRRYTQHGAMKARATGDYAFSRSVNISTRSLLQSFVSSHKADAYRCRSLDETSFISPPYACAFTHGSKNGSSTILAVATEQGSLEILNTVKRPDWEFEPPRTTRQPHQNGIFDVKWSNCDTFIATASGDHTTRITDLRAEQTLHTLRGHLSTVKCISWDPNHRDLLSTGGRDGRICLWDLREQGNKSSGEGGLFPMLSIPWAHEAQPGKLTKKGKAVNASRSITAIVYAPSSSNEIVSSCSYDGILRMWDVRQVSKPVRPRSKKAPTAHLTPIDESLVDPTAMHSSRRPRGISSIALGTGPTEAMLFGLGNDSKIHTYNTSGAAGILLSINQGHGEHNTYMHERMSTNSFYVKVSISPCGRWLASGGADGSAFLFDVAARNPGRIQTERGVQLKGQQGEVGAIDWAEGQLATCADDGTVRIWRPDFDVHQSCLGDPEEARWGWSWAI